MTMAQHIAEGVLIIEHEMSTIMHDEGDPWGEFTECRDLPVHPELWGETVTEVATLLADWVADHAGELDGLDDEQLRSLGEDLQLGLYGDAPTEDWPAGMRHLFDVFPEVVTNPCIENTPTPEGDVPCVAFEIDHVSYRYNPEED